MTIEKINIRVDRTFDSFKISESNLHAQQEALVCVTHFNKEQRLLWLYSDTGLGCTHLLQAIGNQLLEKQPHVKIQHIHSERFTTEFSHTLNEKKEFDED